MKISLFQSVKGGVKGQLCDWPTLLSFIDSKSLAQKAANIAAGATSLKSSLPAVTWQSFFPDGERRSEKAVPNGLFMLDIDHVESPGELWSRIAGRREELGIRICHKTISTHGLRLVANCRAEFGSIEENQRWLAEQIGVEYDAVCKDWARASFLVPTDYFYYMDAKVFDPAVEADFVLANQPSSAPSAPSTPSTPSTRTQTEFRGIPLRTIAERWLTDNGGIPAEGERNARLHKLALRMRYITDFDPNVIANNIPHCGLKESEVRQLCGSACASQRAADMPADMQHVLNWLMKENAEPAEPQQDEALAEEEIIDTQMDFVLPPIFKQFCDVAPDDFKKATVLCLLPVLGTLGSRLRAPYINKKLETPSFMVALEGAQASGKSFIEPMSERCLEPLLQKDEEERQKERAYEEEVKAARLAPGRSKEERDKLRKQLIAEKPTPIVRRLPATASITKLLMRMENAQGLHLFALAVEIDTVSKAFKRGFSNLSDLLRCAFDNAEYGQDYASDTSYSGSVNIFYNTLYSGTPKAIRRFYNDEEDGTMSRTIFITLPDQFGKPMPIWRDMTEAEKAVVDVNLWRLYEVSIKGDEVLEEHLMDLDFLNKKIEQWMEAQRQLTLKTGDRTRNTFYRRCAEVGFRAGMLAYYLWGESAKPTIKNNVGKFAVWVSNMMLKEFVMRVRLEDDTGNRFFGSVVYNALPDTFSREEMEKAMKEYGFETELKSLLSRWKRSNLIKTDKKYAATHFEKCQSVKV